MRRLKRRASVSKMDKADIERLTLVLPEYTIVGLIGEGSSSKVYSIESIHSKKTYACKEVLNIFESDEKTRAMLREVQIMRHLTEMV